MGKQSVVHHVDVLFQEALAIGTKRHQAKAWLREQRLPSNTMTPKIHSFNTFKTYRSRSMHFVDWARATYAVRRLKDLRPEMVVAFIEFKRQSGCQPNTLATYLTALRRLGQLCRGAGLLYTPLVPEHVRVGRVFAPRGAYSSKEADAVIAEVTRQNPAAGEVVRVQRAFGLRLNEVVHLKNKSFPHAGSPDFQLGINYDLGCVFVRGKGGLQRTVTPTQPHALVKIRADVLVPLLPEGYTMKTWKRELQRLVRRACRHLGIACHGTHGFRATAAREFQAGLVAAGTSEKAANQATTEWLGHRRPGVLRHYFEPKD